MSGGLGLGGGEENQINISSDVIKSCGQDAGCPCPWGEEPDDGDL